MEIQEFFYWTASISLILVGLFVISLFVLLYYIKKLADKALIDIRAHVDEISRNLSSASRTWRNLALSRFVLRVLRFIF